MTAAQIRRIRNKPGYKRLLSNLLLRPLIDDHPAPRQMRISPVQSEGPIDSSIKLKQFVIERYDMIHISNEDLSDLLCERLSKAMKRELIDREYEKWISTKILHKSEQTRSRKKPKFNHRTPNESIANDGNGQVQRKFHKEKMRNSKQKGEKIRRQKYFAKLQTLFRKNASAAAQLVLREEYEDSKCDLPCNMVDYWTEVFQEMSVEDNRSVNKTSEDILEMQEPVTKWEVQIAFRRLKNSSPGQDGIKKYHLRKFSFDDLAAHMSLWLLVGIPPASFKTGLVTLIPKNREASSPGDYRPITVSPIMSRLFHRVLASRMSTSWSLSPRQKAFCPGDGVAQNIYLIKSILQKKREQLQKLNITFVDVSKAFDSVSRASLLRAASRLGTPPLLLNYISDLYQGRTVRLRVGDGLSGLVLVNRGVRQGDPMSPILFNAVIEMITSELDQTIGISSGRESSSKCNYIAFADDLVMMSSTDIGMTILLEQLECAMAGVGLKLNPLKCASLRTETHSKQKLWIVNPTPYLKVQHQDIRAIDISQTYKYLGTEVGPRLKFISLREKVQKSIHAISRAPLKPCQRLYVLKVHLIPSLVHTFTFENISLKALASSDTAIRKATRKWVHLPEDVPIPFYHTPIKYGGMGIPQLKEWVPRLRIQRLKGILSESHRGNDNFMADVSKDNVMLMKEFRKFGKDVTAMPKDAWKRGVAESLYRTVDGYGLRSFSGGISEWITAAVPKLPSGQYVRCLKVRAAALYCKMRAARWGHQINTDCDAGCESNEYLGT